MSAERGVSSVIAVVLLVAITIIVATTISAFALGLVGELEDPPPYIAESSGEFEPGNQTVQLTNIAGDSVDIEELEIIVRATGPSLDAEARLVNLPSTSSRLLNENIEGNDDLIDQSFGSAELIVDDGVKAWSAGRTIEFQINVGGADFRDPPKHGNPDAEELEIVVIHTPSGTTLVEEIFDP